jgi:hypothetical protein
VIMKSMTLNIVSASRFSPAKTEASLSRPDRLPNSERRRFSCTSDAQKESHRDHEDTERIRVALDAIPCQKFIDRPAFIVRAEVYDAQHCKRITIQSRENGGFSLTAIDDWTKPLMSGRSSTFGRAFASGMADCVIESSVIYVRSALFCLFSAQALTVLPS